MYLQNPVAGSEWQCLFCEHYKRSLPHATFYHHQKRYYDESSGSWSQLYSNDKSMKSTNSDATRKSLTDAVRT